MGEGVRKGRNGNKTHGRNKADCAKYANEGRLEKNKAVKLARHIKRVPWDLTARAAFDALPVLAKRGHELPKVVSKPPTGIWRRVPAVHASVGVELSNS